VAGTERVDGESGGRRFPVKVVVVDVERCPEEISAAHPGGGRYVGLWVLARVGGEPRSLIKLPFVGDRITASELAECFRGPAFEPRASAPVVDADPPVLVSVVLCTTFEREQELRNCLASLAELDYPSYEVLLVDNRRQDGESVAWVEDYPRVRLLRERQPGLAAARNRGLSAAAGEIVAFTDDDVVVDRGWLTAYARRFAARPEEAGVGGLVIPAELESEAQVAVEEYYGGLNSSDLQPLSYRLERPAGAHRATMVGWNQAGDPVSPCSLYAIGSKVGGGASMAFRTDVLREIGGFDVRLGAGTPSHGAEDLILWMRLAWRGYSVGFEPAAFVSHIHRREDEQLRRQIENYGVGFSAMMTALVLEDPRHLVAMFAATPEVIAVMGRLFLKRLRTKAPEDAGAAAKTGPSNLAQLELRGMARGPVAYAHSAQRARRWRAGGWG
jgi:GT2 family glycosyltransferase